MKTFIQLILYIFVFSQLNCTRQRNNLSEGILYWCSNNTDEIAFAKAVVEKWNKENRHQPVRFQPVPEGQSSEEVILAAVVGKTTPDIYSNMWQGDVELYARAGKLVALDKIPGFLQFIYQRCDSSVVKEVTSRDGHIYQIPWKINPIMMIYNKRLFNEIGFANPPRTYSEYIEAARRLKERSRNDKKWIGYVEVIVTWWQRLFDFYPLYLAASGGANLVKNDKVVFDNKYAVETFSFLKTLYDNGFFPRDKLSAQQDPFLSGRIATRFTGPWEIAHAEKFKPEGFEYSFSTLPVPDDFKNNIYTYGDTKNIVIFNTCKNVQLAWNIIKFMISRENDFLLLQITDQLPRRRDLSADPQFKDYFEKHSLMKSFAKQSKLVRGPDNSPVLKEIFDIISREYEACVVYGKKSPEKAVKDAESQAKLLLLE